MSEKFNAENKYVVVSLQQKPFLFTNARIDRTSVPEDLFVYDVGDSDGDGCYARVQRFVMVNHWGTVIGPYELDLGKDGVYYPELGSEEYEGCYFDDMTIEELKASDIAGFETAPVSDGEYAAFQGNRYQIECVFEGNFDRKSFSAEMSEQWPYSMVGVSELNIEKGGHRETKVSMQIMPVCDTRNQKLYDTLFCIGDAIGCDFSGDSFRLRKIA